MLHEWHVSDIAVENESLVTQWPLTRRVHDKNAWARKRYYHYNDGGCE